MPERFLNRPQVAGAGRGCGIACATFGIPRAGLPVTIPASG
jgi:hypothetical protein